MLEELIDVLVVGAGMGGSIVASACANAGLRTVVVEHGGDPRLPQPDRRGPIAKLTTPRVDTTGERWSQKVTLTRGRKAAPREISLGIGVGPGGSARIYGGALGRARRADFECDFQPRDWGYDTPALPNAWPVPFDDFKAAYRRAEEMLGIVGTRDPLDPDDDAVLGTPPSLSPAHAAMVERLQANGRHPFRMHVGIEYRPGCSECQGVTCARECKAHGFNRALKPALSDNRPVTLRRNLTVNTVRRTEAGEWYVNFVDEHGEQGTLKARALVLAAGALNTPRLLQASSSSVWQQGAPALLGRGLMFHGLEVFAVFPGRRHALHGVRKVIAFRDHYMDQGMPLAECQSLGVVGKPGMVEAFLHERLRQAGINLRGAARLLVRAPAEAGARLFAGAELFTAALQDLPYAENRVSTSPTSSDENGIAIAYHAPQELVMRARRLRALVREAFDPMRVVFLSRPGIPNLGHPMGTCRMGGDPSTSVVDPEGQVWDMPGLYVADASVFPSSLGINPALTVAAHAIRVGDAVVQRFGRDKAEFARHKKGEALSASSRLRA